MGCSLINYPFGGAPIYGNPHMSCKTFLANCRLDKFWSWDWKIGEGPRSHHGFLTPGESHGLGCRVPCADRQISGFFRSVLNHDMWSFPMFNNHVHYWFTPPYHILNHVHYWFWMYIPMMEAGKQNQSTESWSSSSKPTDRWYCFVQGCPNEQIKHLYKVVPQL